MDQVKILVLINTINRLYYIYILYSFSLVSIGNEECWRQIEAIQAYYPPCTSFSGQTMIKISKWVSRLDTIIIIKEYREISIRDDNNL